MVGCGFLYVHVGVAGGLEKYFVFVVAWVVGGDVVLDILMERE